MTAGEVNGLNERHVLKAAATSASPSAFAEIMETVAPAATAEAPPPGTRSAPFAKFQRRMERFRTTAPEAVEHPTDDEPELRLQLMLLREENARLKAGRHQPAAAGTLIEEVRALGAQSDLEALDDVWSLIGECLQIQGGLDQACAEIIGAVENVRQRLGVVADKIENALADGSAGEPRKASSVSVIQPPA